MNLKNQIAVVTGGAKGIGKDIVMRLSEEGAKVVIADTDFETAQEAANKISEDGAEVIAIKADVAKVDEICNLFESTVSEFGRLDILVNNAGIQIRSSSLDFSEENWDKLMDLNLKGVFFCAQAAARIMVRQGGGKILNISSGTSVRITPGRAPYGISKAAVNNLTAVLGAEWAKYGVRVNAVAPGWIMTDLLRDGIKSGVVSEEEITSITPMNRLGTRGEVADAVAFLVSDRASYICGHTLIVDGGWTNLGVPQRANGK